MASGDIAAKARRPRKSRRLNLTHAERSEVVKRRLFEAAVKIVGEIGYADATVSRITQRAGVAQGTFYNHFPSRQDLLDQLLPRLGQQMVAFIGERVRAVETESEIEVEVARFRAFFDFLIEAPEFMRILNDARVFAPAGYAEHIEVVEKNYIRALRRSGIDIAAFSPAELQVVVQILMGARSYLCQSFSYTNGVVHKPSQAVYTAYEKLIRFGLFGRSAEMEAEPAVMERRTSRSPR